MIYFTAFLLFSFPLFAIYIRHVYIGRAMQIVKMAQDEYNILNVDLQTKQEEHSQLQQRYSILCAGVEGVVQEYNLNYSHMIERQQHLRHPDAVAHIRQQTNSELPINVPFTRN